MYFPGVRLRWLVKSHVSRQLASPLRSNCFKKMGQDPFAQILYLVVYQQYIAIVNIYDVFLRQSMHYVLSKRFILNKLSGTKSYRWWEGVEGGGENVFKTFLDDM